MLTTEHDIRLIEKSFAALMDQAEHQVVQCGRDEIAIDCSAIALINSHMLDRLIRLHLDARQAGAHVVLENVSDIVFDVISLTRLDRMLRIRFDQAHAKPQKIQLHARQRSFWGKRS